MHIPSPHLISGQIGMKDKQCAETYEKTIFIFEMCLIFANLIKKCQPVGFNSKWSGGEAPLTYFFLLQFLLTFFFHKKNGQKLFNLLRIFWNIFLFR